MGIGSKVRWHGRCHWQVRQELSFTAAREQPPSASYRQARVHPTGELPCKPSPLTIPVDDERSPNERHVASQLQRTLPPFSNNPPSRHPASRRQSQFTIGTRILSTRVKISFRCQSPPTHYPTSILLHLIDCALFNLSCPLHLILSASPRS